MDINSFINNIQTGNFFKENYNLLMTNEGLNHLFYASIITGLIYMLSQLISNKKEGFFTILWLFVSGFICTGLAHALLQILTGLPFKMINL